MKLKRSQNGEFGVVDNTGKLNKNNWNYLDKAPNLDKNNYPTYSLVILY